MKKDSWANRADKIARRHAREVYKTRGENAHAVTLAIKAFRAAFEKSFDALAKRG